MKTQQTAIIILLLAVLAPFAAAGPGETLELNCVYHGGSNFHNYVIFPFRPGASPLIYSDLATITFDDSQVHYVINKPIANVIFTDENLQIFSDFYGSDQENTATIGPEYTYMQICYAKDPTPPVDVPEFSILGALTLGVIGAALVFTKKN